MTTILPIRTIMKLTSAAIAMALAPVVAHGQLVRELSPTDGASQSYGQAVNASGVVVGYSREAFVDVPTVWRPTPGGYIAELLPLPAGEPMGGANAIGAGGAIAGYTQPEDGSTATAAVWTPSGGGYTVTPLAVPAGAALAAAYAINATGQAAGFATDASDISIGITWTPTGGGSYNTTLLPFPGRTDSVATAVNNQGDIAGYTNGTGGLLGAVWLNNGGGTYTPKTVISGEDAIITAMNEYGTGAGVYDGDQPLVMVYFEGDFYALNLSAPFGTTHGASNAVNNFDALAGYVKDPTTATLGEEAALWLPTETQWDFVNLDQWLDATDPLLGAKWTLTDALSLTDNWLVAGNGLYDPDGLGPLPAAERAFLLDVSSLVPEPSALAMALLAAPTLLRRRRVRCRASS